MSEEAPGYQITKCDAKVPDTTKPIVRDAADLDVRRRWSGLDNPKHPVKHLNRGDGRECESGCLAHSEIFPREHCGYHSTFLSHLGAHQDTGDERKYKGEKLP